MAQSGFNRGYNQGHLQGAKTGLGMARHMSGYKSGTVSGTVYNKEKIQDPILLAASNTRAPFSYWNADNVTLSGTNVTAVTNLIPIYNPLFRSANVTLSALSSDPAYVANGVNNNRAYIAFDANDGFGIYPLTTPDFRNTGELTLMFVTRANTAGCIFCFNDESIFKGSGTCGDCIIESSANGIFTITVNGNTNSSGQQEIWTSSDAKSRDGDWVLLTVKFRLSLRYGRYSAVEIHLNGTKNQTLSSGEITAFASSNFTITTNIIYGNRSSFSGTSGCDIAAGLICEQWLNESEQLRIENYFRDYYGIKF